MLIPSIDIMGGKAVQLVGGKDKVLEIEDVVGLAERFRVFGEIAVVDLDAALGRGDNTALVERLCAIAACRVGGGIRDRARAERLLRAGATRLVIGTAADEAFLDSLPRSKIVVAVDHGGGRVLSHGWTVEEKESPLDRIRRLESRCGGFLVTSVDREGRMGGIDIDAVKGIRAATKRPVTVAGGIVSSAEVALLDRMGLDAQVGMALYTGRLDPAACFVECVDFSKGEGMAPCVVEDPAGRILMLAWQTRETLGRALRERRGIYHSRTRASAWVKGETSGNVQALLAARVDCDRDTVLFTVEQSGPACHTGEATCFGPTRFGLHDLERIVASRRSVPRPDSYTARLLSDPAMLDAKLREEIEEVIEAKDRPDDLVWECADVIYHVLVRMGAAGVRLRQVEAELERRRK